MAVDIKGRGLDYLLKEGLPKRDGVEIRASFYEKLTTYELQSFEKEIEDLVRYFQIPVYLNGERISKDPLKEKWTHETDDAWIKLNPSGRVLTLYNLGMKVTDYGSYKFGVGGVVVTKPGATLTFDALVAFLREQRIAAFKLPERLEVVDELPLSPVGKILKRELRERITAVLAREAQERR